MTNIKVTKDYTIFKDLNGNRQINWTHVERLEKVMLERELLSSLHPILINEKFEVIDGQHRLEALKRLERPVYYLQGENLDLKDVQMLNAFSKNWTHHDFALSFSKLGYPNYSVYLDIESNYKVNKLKLKHNVLLAYLTQSKSKDQNLLFKLGELQIPDEKKSRLLLEQLIEIVKVSDDTKRFMGRDFGIAFFQISTSSKYNHKRMMSKMSKFSNKIGKCESIQDFQREVEKIYNYFTPIEEQVRFF